MNGVICYENLDNGFLLHKIEIIFVILPKLFETTPNVKLLSVIFIYSQNFQLINTKNKYCLF